MVQKLALAIGHEAIEWAVEFYVVIRTNAPVLWLQVSTRYQVVIQNRSLTWGLGDQQINGNDLVWDPKHGGYRTIRAFIKKT